MGQREITNRLRAYEGMLTGSVKDRVIKTGIASGTIYGGKAVCEYDSAQIDPNKKKVKLPTSVAEAKACVGLVPVLETHGQTEGLNYDVYLDKALLSYVTEGRAWVVCENAITDLTKPVYIKRANGNLTQVFYLTIQSGAAADKVYSFNLVGPDGSITAISHTSVDDDETAVATAVAALIDAVTGIGASAASSVITCTAAVADERWKCTELVAADIVLTGETTPTAGVLGAFRSGADTPQVFTITLADTAAADKLYPLVITNLTTGEKHVFTHIASGAVEATEATAIASLINAITGLGAAAVDEVITVTAASSDVEWNISENADMAVAETTSTDWTKCDKFKFESYEEMDGVFMALVNIKE